MTIWCLSGFGSFLSLFKKLQPQALRNCHYFVSFSEESASKLVCFSQFSYFSPLCQLWGGSVLDKKYSEVCAKKWRWPIDSKEPHSFTREGSHKMSPRKCPQGAIVGFWGVEWDVYSRGWTMRRFTTEGRNRDPGMWWWGVLQVGWGGEIVWGREGSLGWERVAWGMQGQSWRRLAWPLTFMECGYHWRG